MERICIMKKSALYFFALCLCLSSCTAETVRQEHSSGSSAPVSGPARSPGEETPHPSEPTPEAGEAIREECVLKGWRICIDPGHQAAGNAEMEFCAPWNEERKAKCTSGARGNFTGTDEYVLNLSIAQKIREKLSALGAEVYMTREIHAVDLSNRERAEAANRFGADITLRIHCNSAETETVEGIELYVRGEGDGTAEYRKRSEDDFQKAESLIQFLCAETGAVSRGVFRSDAYTGINWCQNTCIIVECGFLSNEREDRLLNTEAYQERLAEGIKNYFVSSALVSSDKNISGL